MSSELVKDVIGSDSMARVRKQKFTLDVPTLQTTLDTCYRVVPMTLATTFLSGAAVLGEE